MEHLDTYEHIRNELYHDVRACADMHLSASKAIWLVREKIEQTLGIVNMNLPSGKELGGTNRSQVLLSRLLTYVNESIDIARRQNAELSTQTRTEREVVPA